MLPKINLVLISLGLAALLAGCGRASNSSQEPEHGMATGKMESMPDSKQLEPVHTIVMLHDEPLFPPGPGREEFVTACVVCHSPRYITMQPPFTRSAWLGEVNKMKDVYGAHISDQQVPRILDYLVSINGEPDPVGAPTAAIHGE